MSLTDHPEGNYRFLPGIAPYSCGAVSAPGFEVVHAVLQRPLPYRAGFERIAAHLAAAGRPKAALCGVELRSPALFSFPGFAAFNGEYAAILKEWGLFVNGLNPVARTNVAPVVHPPGEPALYGFSYTPAPARSRRRSSSPARGNSPKAFSLPTALWRRATRPRRGLPRRRHSSWT